MLILPIKRHRFVPLASVFATLAAVVGCNEPQSETVVDGVVTLAGNPVERGAIQCFPLAGDGATAGAEISAGRFSVQVRPGSYRVEINVPKTVGARPAYNVPDSPMLEIVEELAPAKYNVESVLRLNVAANMPPVEYHLDAK